MTQARDQDLLPLLSAWCNGQLNADDAGKLAALLRDDAAARQTFLDYVGLHAELRRSAAAGTETSSLHPQGMLWNATREPELTPARRRWKQSLANWSRRAWQVAQRPTSISLTTAFLALGTVLCILAFIAIPIYRQSIREPNVAERQVVAKITRTHAAKWKGISADDEQEVYLKAGDRIDLREGFADILFYNGASVIVQGPSLFQVDSPSAGRLEEGQLTAVVPDKSKGFSIRSPSTTVIDLGTEFGVHVDKKGVTNVEVFKGRVEVIWIDRADFPAERKTLGEGEAVRVAIDGSGIEAAQQRPTEFVRTSTLNKLVDEDRHQRSRDFASALANDPSVAALFTFERVDDSPQILSNLAANQQADGRIAGAQWDVGRWADKKALRFAEGRDAVDLQLDGTCEQLTLTTWVNLDQFQHTHNALLHSDDWTREGAVHWTLLADGRMELAMGGSGHEPNLAQSDPLGRRLQRWVHLAVVYDAQAKLARFYCNGAPKGTRNFTTANFADVRQAQLGNWSPESRNLAGRMDEFIVLRRALSDGEIQRIYAAGAP